MSPGAEERPERRRTPATGRPAFAPPRDEIEINSADSFPASDPPSWTPVRRTGRPDPRTQESSEPSDPALKPIGG
jgi:hypothetical protein